MAVLFAVLLVLCLFLLYIYYSYVHRPYQLFKKMGVPGPKPDVFFGSYKKLSSFKGGVAGLESQRYLTTKYGSMCGYYIGYHPYLMVTDPDVVREVLVKKFDHFRCRGAQPILRFGTTATLIDATDGDVWKRLRQAISPSFSARKLRLMESLMSRPIDRLLTRIDQAASSGSCIDIHSWFSELVTELLLAVFFGKAAEVQGQKDGQSLVESIMQSFEATKTGGKIDIYRGKVISSAFPFIIPMLRFGLQRSSMGTAMNKVFTVALKIVEDRKQSTLSHNDFLQQIIGAGLSSDEVMSQVISMMFAGNETVTSALASAAYLLALHPDVQEKLLQEIGEYFSEHPDSSLHDAIELPYLDNVISEVLRYYPPFTKVSRVCEKQCVIGGVTIPVGLSIDIPLYYLHHHPNYWTDPDVFNPERFHSSNKDNIQPFTYLPFSDGPRNCIGSRFALMEIKMVLVHILKKYKFVQLDETKVPLPISIGVTLGPKSGLMLGFQCHRSF